MKVLLHDGDCIIEYPIPDEPELPPTIEFKYFDKSVYHRSDRKADGMTVYYRFDLGEALLKDEEEKGE